MYQQQQRKGVCFNFQKGTCKHGDSCRFAHEYNGDTGQNRDRNRGFNQNNNNNGNRQNYGRHSHGGGRFNDNKYGGEKRRYSDSGNTSGNVTFQRPQKKPGILN